MNTFSVVKSTGDENFYIVDTRALELRNTKDKTDIRKFKDLLQMLRHLERDGYIQANL